MATVMERDKGLRGREGGRRRERERDRERERERRREREREIESTGEER